ncbi:MAG: leucine-rich repeat domain-containing protein [Candidatus Methanogranum gryphiswaldense]|nr:MAG: leucine-rich repeat domain-containing protein [Candidatus Methanogranum sp. U3.2.1]
MNMSLFNRKRTLYAILLTVLLTTTVLAVTYDKDDSSAVVADTFNDGKFYYSITSEENNEVSITDTMVSTGSISIPSSVEHYGKTYNVTSIGNNAFYGCSGLTGSLTIPDSITVIGSYAFYGCSGLTGSLTIPDSLTTLNIYAFCNCSGLTGSLTISDSLTRIGFGAFSGCSGFTGSLTIPGNVTMIDNFAFYGCSGFNGSLIISGGVKTVGFSSFENCTGFTTLTIPWSVNVIENTAFKNCIGLTSISISSNPKWTDIMSNDVFSGITFYDETGTTVLEQTASNLCRYSFSGTYEHMVRGDPIEINSINFYDEEGWPLDEPIQPDVAKGSSFIIPSYSGIKTGYVFSGWNDGTAIYAAGSTYTTGSSDVSFTIVWTATDSNDADDSNSSTDWLLYATIVIVILIVIGLAAYYFKIRKNA